MENSTDLPKDSMPPGATPPDESTLKSTPRIVSLEKLPPALTAKRKEIRKMMELRCQEPGSPIPPKLSTSAADAIFFLALIRVTHRVINKKPAYPDAQTLTEDIARSAESIETCVMVMCEEAVPPEVPAIQLLR
jgi:hypothetical protein